MKCFDRLIISKQSLKTREFRSQAPSGDFDENNPFGEEKARNDPLAKLVH
jgi:hypothetical protein